METSEIVNLITIRNYVHSIIGGTQTLSQDDYRAYQLTLNRVNAALRVALIGFDPNPAQSEVDESEEIMPIPALKHTPSVRRK